MLSEKNRFLPNIRFKVRNAQKIDQNLKRSPICRGFIPVPVFVQKKGAAPSNALATDIACRYAKSALVQLGQRDSSYEPHLGLVDRLKEPFRQSFGLSATSAENMTFLDAVKYSDAIVARDFEGLPLYSYDFSKSQF